MKRVLVSVTAVVAVGAAGCSGGSTPVPSAGGSPGGSSAASTPAATASATPSLNGEQSKTAEQVLADAKSALFNTSAVHVKGTETEQGKTQTLDLQLQGEDTAGTLTTSGVTLNIVKTASKVYLKAPEQFWVKSAGASIAPKLANRWLEQDATKAGDTTSLTLQGVAASLNASGSALKPGVTPTVVGGQPAVLVTKVSGSQLAVANSGAPLPLQIIGKGTTVGTLTFTGYGQAQSISPPAGALTAEQAVKVPSAGKA